MVTTPAFRGSSAGIVLCIIVFITIGGVQETKAARKCTFSGSNGKLKHKLGAEVLSVPEACTTFTCERAKNKNGKVSKKKVVITAQTDSSCTCNIPAMIKFNDKTVNLGQYRNTTSIYKVGVREVLETSKGTRTISTERRIPDSNRVSDKAPSKRTNRQAKKKMCRYNKRKFRAGRTVKKFPQQCFNLVCVKKSKTLSIIEAQFQSSCTCGGGGGGGGGAGGGGGNNADCDDYKKFTNDHSMCKPESTSCTKTAEGISASEKKKILKIHNDLRAKVALGEEERGTPGPQPPAKNMRQVVWNDELARVAQAWANTCTDDHDCYDCRKILSRDYLVGQNLYWSWSFDTTEDWEKALTAFYDEVQWVPKSLVDEYKQIITVDQIGHYTQLVWAKTYEIGCGAFIHGPCFYSGMNWEVCKVYACNYGVAGNFIGLPIYIKGNSKSDAATDCDEGKSTKYNGLCN